MKIVDLVGQWAAMRQESGQYVSDAVALQCAIDASAMYAGYTKLLAMDEEAGAEAIDGNLDLSISEWAVIRPLALLYVEREQAIALEGARASGVEGIGRTTSEVAAEIAQYEAEISGRAYGEVLFSVGPEGF